jgi:hypothetical protein
MPVFHPAARLFTNWATGSLFLTNVCVTLTLMRNFVSLAHVGKNKAEDWDRQGCVTRVGNVRNASSVLLKMFWRWDNLEDKLSTVRRRLVVKMNPKRNTMSNFRLDPSGLVKDLWRAFVNTVIRLCMQSKQFLYRPGQTLTAAEGCATWRW